MWQLLTWYVVVTRNLTRRNMRSDNYCLTCGESEEIVTQPSLDVPQIFKYGSFQLHHLLLTSFHYQAYMPIWTTSFEEKNDIVKVELDRDSYPWIIWYIWKARNDKLFRGIDRDPLELVRYAESEWQTSFNANEVVTPDSQESSHEEAYIISLDNLCMIDDSWTDTTQYSTVDADGFGKIILGRFSLWGCEM